MQTQVPLTDCSPALEVLISKAGSQVPSVKGKPAAENQALLLEMVIRNPLPAARSPDGPLGRRALTISARGFDHSSSDIFMLQNCQHRKGSSGNPQILDQAAQTFLILLLKKPRPGDMKLPYTPWKSDSFKEYVFKIPRYFHKNTMPHVSLCFPERLFSDVNVLIGTGRKR